MTTPPNTEGNEDRELEGLAMNIVYQIGDALYEALPPQIAHDHFVDARQATNDVAIDFAKKLIKQHESALLSRIKEEQEDLYSRPASNAIAIPAVPLSSIDNIAKEIKGDSYDGGH